jgi:hypothetical protein
MHLPHPTQSSELIFTKEPEPSLQNLLGQTEMHLWQFTHFSESTKITGRKFSISFSPRNINALNQIFKT